jgi:hypothetical protein
VPAGVEFSVTGPGPAKNRTPSRSEVGLSLLAQWPGSRYINPTAKDQYAPWRVLTLFVFRYFRHHIVMSDRKLTVNGTVDGLAVAGRCSRCHHPFEYEHATPENAKEVNRRLAMDFEKHSCHVDVNQPTERVSTCCSVTAFTE